MIEISTCLFSVIAWRTIPKNACFPFTFKISTYGFLIIQAFLVCIENNFSSESNNIRRIDYNIHFKDRHINELIVDIANTNALFYFDLYVYNCAFLH